MRLLRDKRGQVRVIEAFFASVLLLSSLTVIPLVQRSSAEDAGVSLSATALNVLVSLDSDGQLARLVAAGNWSALKCEVESCVGVGVWFNLTVFDEGMNRLNDVQVCSGGAVSDHVDVADYVCSAVDAGFAVYVLRLQLAVVN